MATFAPNPGTTAAPRRVLIVDDNGAVADSMRDLLHVLGHAAEVARDGEQALQKARVFAPDILLCDLKLPGMNGYEVARAFRADPALATITLVALSGYSGSEVQRQAEAAGYQQQLTKPARIEALLEVLARR